jgi:hypothetical protein
MLPAEVTACSCAHKGTSLAGTTAQSMPSVMLSVAALAFCESHTAACVLPWLWCLRVRSKEVAIALTRSQQQRGLGSARQ